MKDAGMKEFGRLIEAEIPRLRRFATSLAGDPHRAEDLVQDCLERAWRKSHLWRRGSNIRAWLFTILHNLFANQARRFRSGPQFVPLEDVLWQRGQTGAQEAHVRLDQVWRALQQLPEEQRAVVLLVGMEQMRYEDAAQILEIPIGTVMSRLFRGRERLRAIIPSGGRATLRRIR